MNPALIGFGERLDGYPVPVLNERAVRASAGILFVGALVSFMNAWLTGNFQPTRVFVLVFLLDFSIRLFINPIYSPSFMLGQWAVRRQQAEYVGAPQKRFAWAIGFALALVMSYLVVLKGVVGPLNIIVCGTCLILMFFETSFGICLGCKVYNAVHQDKAKLCPGGVCEVDPAQAFRPSLRQAGAFIVFVAAATAAGTWALRHDPYPPKPAPVDMSQVTPAPDAAEAERCKVPDFAKAIGHEAQWKLHNNCR